MQSQLLITGQRSSTTSTFRKENLIVSIYTPTALPKRKVDASPASVSENLQPWNSRQRISIMGRSPCYSKEGLNHGAWTAKEDTILSEYIRIHGAGGWTNLPRKAGLKRSGKSCRLRWLNYLRPDIKRGNISPDEEDLIIRLHRLLGNRWSLIAGRLPERTDNEIKNYWNTHVSKKLLLMNQSSTTANLKKMSKSPSMGENHVLITTSVEKAMAVTQSEMVRSSSFSVCGCSNRNSHEGFQSCHVKETKNSSKPFSGDLPAVVSDSITKNDSQPIAKKSRNSTRSMSSLVECGRSPDSDSCSAGDATTLAETLLDLKELSTPDCNLLSSPSEFCTGFGLEEFYMEPATLAVEEIEFEITCSDQTNMQRVNNFTLDFYSNTEDLDWIFEVDYTQK